MKIVIGMLATACAAVAFVCGLSLLPESDGEEDEDDNDEAQDSSRGQDDDDLEDDEFPEDEEDERSLDAPSGVASRTHQP